MTDWLVIYLRWSPLVKRDNGGVNQPQPPIPPTTGPAPTTAEAVTHYENFPVASLLCPPHLRQPIAAIYGFARTADDLADEGTADTTTRLADLQAYQADLLAVRRETPAA